MESPKLERVQVANPNCEVKGWFLTYPKCDLLPQDALEILKASFQVVEYVIAQEKHADGTDHLHIFLKTKKKVSWSATRFDLGSFHGNYQAARSWEAVQRYCKKGGNFIASFDTDKALRKKSCGRLLNKRLLEEDLTELVKSEELPLENYLKVKACKEAFFKDTAPELPRAVSFLPNSWEKVLPVHSGKQRHFWIWSSKPNTGKTTFLESISAQYSSYWYCYKEAFQDVHPKTQFILLDEYTSPHLPVTQLNLMCDGHWQYPFKGGSAVLLEKPILLVCSNKPPEEVYPNAYPLIKVRFVVVEL